MTVNLKVGIAIREGVRVFKASNAIFIKGRKAVIKLYVPLGLTLVKREKKIYFNWGHTKISSSLRSFFIRFKQASSGVFSLYTERLVLRGVGYQVFKDQSLYSLSFSLGYSHKVWVTIPKGVFANVVKNKRLSLKGPFVDQVTSFSKVLSGLRKRDPYKGKGLLPKGFMPLLKKAKRLSGSSFLILQLAKLLILLTSMSFTDFVKHLKPKTPASRGAVIVNSRIFPRQRRLKSLSLRTKAFGGRNNRGAITVYNKSGPKQRKLSKSLYFHKMRYVGIVTLVERLPGLKGAICRWFDFSSRKFFRMPFVSGIRPGSIITGDFFFTGLRLGGLKRLSEVPAGFLINHLSLYNNFVAKSPGTKAQLMFKGLSSCTIRLPSGAIIHTSSRRPCFLGSSGFESFYKLCDGKAGRSRSLGKRPKVRGVAMNPVDHPHGGGEGKTSGGRPSVTPWGRPTKGVPTKSKKRKNVEETV